MQDKILLNIAHGCECHSLHVKDWAKGYHQGKKLDDILHHL